MTTILSQSEALEQEEFTTVSTTFDSIKGQSFPGRTTPTPIVRSIGLVAQTSARDIDADDRSYYLSSPSRIGVAPLFLQPQSYNLKTIEEQSKELKPDDIAVYALSRSVVERNQHFVQPILTSKRGKFLSFLANSLLVHLPQPQSKLQDIESGEEQSRWRGVSPLPSSTRVLFSETIEVKVSELPVWKPNVVIDGYRIEDDDE